MALQLQVSNILQAKDALQKLSNEKLPVRGSFLMARALRALEPEYQIVEKKRADIIKELGVEKEGMIEVKPEKMGEFSTRFNAILETYIEVAMEAIPLSTLGDVKISPMDLMALEPFLLDDVHNGN